MACAGCAQAAMKADQDWAVPPCVLLWLRLLGSSGHRSEKDVCDLVQNAKNALSARIHTPRERELVGAIEWLSNGDLGETRHAVERCLVHAPADAMLLKFQTDICLFGGFSHQMRDAIARSLPMMDCAKTPMFSFVLGMQAFALEESGDTLSAISIAKSALELNKKDMWALHALTHALDQEGRTLEAVSSIPSFFLFVGDVF